MNLQGMRKEIQSLKNELVPDFRPINVLLQTKATGMTAAEIDRLVQEIPIRELPTDVLVSVLDREIDKVNAHLGTFYKTYTEITPEHRKMLSECRNNEPAAD
jgi:hypothetical protein